MRKNRAGSGLGKLLTNSTSGLFSTPTTPPHLTLHALLEGKSAKPLAPEVEKLRIIKSPAEIALMKRAGDISSEAHAGVMRAATKGMQSEVGWTEGMLAAEFEYRCAMKGSERGAYVPVVASG